MDSATIEAHVAAVQRDGYTILEGIIEPELVDGLTADLEHLEQFFDVQPSANSFEGSHTLRVYNLLALGKRFEAVPVHEQVLPVVEGVLDPGCLVSSLSSITILPGEDAQPIHADDQLIPIPKPHVPTVCNTMWALTDFTEANGATRLIPGRTPQTRRPTTARRTTRSPPRCRRAACSSGTAASGMAAARTARTRSASASP